MLTSGEEPGEILDWDSKFFGRRIARVREMHESAVELSRVCEWARAEAVDCLYFLADAADTTSIRAAESAGFHLTDVRVVRERDVPRPSTNAWGVDVFRAEDLPALKAIAGISHVDSRFYNDPEFPDELCSALYETWIERACGGRANTVLVAREADRPCGYVACVLPSPESGRIDLIAVAPDSRGKGIGAELVRACLAWSADRGCHTLEVITQARNVPAARLYEQLGFRTVSVGHWYHLWLPAGRSGATR
jgi:dTDP-4-amino-4,6-dideoxy-D-galactose acyltransferase